MAKASSPAVYRCRVIGVRTIGLTLFRPGPTYTVKQKVYDLIEDIVDKDSVERVDGE